MRLLSGCFSPLVGFCVWLYFSAIQVLSFVGNAIVVVANVSTCKSHPHYRIPHTPLMFADWKGTP
jgi:hypothetical protein